MRLYYILEDLRLAHNYLTVEYFSKKYDVSTRTIQNDIGYLTQIAPRKGYQIHMRRGKGYLLEIIDEDSLTTYIDTLSQEKAFDSKDRAENILLFITLQDDFISMDQIADIFSISKASVKNCMSNVEGIAKEYALILERKSHYGVRVKSTPANCRNFLYQQYIQDNSFLINEVRRVLDDFTAVHDILVSQIESRHFNINYTELKIVSSWLQIITYYTKRTDNAKRHNFTLEKEDDLTQMVCVLKDTIETLYLIQLDEECIQFIYELLKTNIRQKTPSITFGKELNSAIDRFLQNVDKTYETKFFMDADFKRLLYIHVSLLIDRLHQKIGYKNVMVEEISIRYPMIFNIAIQFGDMLKEKFNVEASHDEIGFLATHFAAHMENEQNMRIQRFNRIGVVCSSGGGSAYLIKRQIESLFPKADVQTYSFLQLENLRKFQPDLIFTIMALNQSFQVPIIHIRELLDEVDLMHIRQALQYENYDLLDMDETSSYMNAIFHRDFFKIRKAKDYPSILQEMAEQIETEGYGGEHYAAYVMERESYMSTVYLQGVAIPHPMYMHANKNLISVVILEEPIYHQEKIVRIIFMISLCKEDYEMHKGITKNLYALMKDETKLNKILQSPSFEELLIVMKEVEGGA